MGFDDPLLRVIFSYNADAACAGLVVWREECSRKDAKAQRTSVFSKFLCVLCGYILFAHRRKAAKFIYDRLPLYWSTYV